MCLAIPGKIVAINKETATADFHGIQKKVNISLVDVIVGDYVIVHAGFAIEVIDEEAAMETYKYLKELDEI